MLERTAARGATAAASGEVAAVVHDGLDGGFGRPAVALRRMPRSRAAAIIGLSAVIVFLLGLAAVGALRPQHPPVPLVRNGIGHAVAARRLALLQAEAAATAKAAVPAPPIVTEDAPTAAATAPPATPARRYKRFE
jgi:hypothetical protein